MNEKKSIITVLLVIFCLTDSSYCSNGLYANPDFFRSSMRMTSEGVAAISIGENISLRGFSVGGMIEVRNERRFNQGVFPNHNWRGVCRAEYEPYKWNNNTLKITVITGLYHESAHPTMGIVEESKKAYELIYDKTYRRMNLNAVNVGSRFQQQLSSGTFFFEGFYHFYFVSKNTPELSGSTLTHGHGLSFGAQWERSVRKTAAFYLSLFDRFMFDSRLNASGDIYFGNGSNLTKQNTSYPVIRQTNTVTVKSGLNRTIGNTGVRIGFFACILYGNPYGFIDSRDKRTLFSAGFEVF